MAPLLSLGLLALTCISSASPVPKKKRSLPSLSVVQRFAALDTPPSAGAPRLVDVEQARASVKLQQAHGGFGWPWPSPDWWGDGGNNHGGGDDGDGGDGGDGGSAPATSTEAAPSTVASTTPTSSAPAASSTGADNSDDVTITNTIVTYLAQVNIGTPATTYNLLIDTGSSNTWAGASASNPFQQTSTTKDTGSNFAVTYGSGEVNGTEVTDTVSLGGDLTVTGQGIGTSTAAQATGFDGVDGILGVGPPVLTQGTLAATPNQEVPTITDTLFKQGVIDTEVLGVSFVPSAMNASANGVLSFGGVDEDAFVGEITYQPITKTEPASFYWGANISLTMGGKTLAGSTAGIVDTGTTLFLLADDIFQAYTDAIPGGAAVDNQLTGLLQIPIDSLSSLPDLNVEWNGVTLPLTADGQVFPRALNTALGGTNDVAYGIVASLGSNSGQGLDFIMGMGFLERFYSIFDTTNQQIGMAFTQQTNMSFFDLPATGSTGTVENAKTSAAGEERSLSSRMLWAASTAVLAVIVA